MRRGGQVPRHLHCTLRGEKEQGGGGPGSRRGGWLLACLLVPREKPDRLERVNQINLPPVRPRATSPFNNIASLFRLVSAERVVVIKSQFPRRRFSRASLGANGLGRGREEASGRNKAASSTRAHAFWGPWPSPEPPLFAPAPRIPHPSARLPARPGTEPGQDTASGDVGGDDGAIFSVIQHTGEGVHAHAHV